MEMVVTVKYDYKMSNLWINVEKRTKQTQAYLGEPDLQEKRDIVRKYGSLELASTSWKHGKPYPQLSSVSLVSSKQSLMTEHFFPKCFLLFTKGKRSHWNKPLFFFFEALLIFFALEKCTFEQWATSLFLSFHLSMIWGISYLKII